MLFEHSGEMLWVFKAQLICCGGDASSADEQLLSLTHDKATNDVSRSIVRYQEEPYVPYSLSGVMAVNKLVMSEELVCL